MARLEQPQRVKYMVIMVISWNAGWLPQITGKSEEAGTWGSPKSSSCFAVFCDKTWAVSDVEAYQSASAGMLRNAHNRLVEQALWGPMIYH